jgi:hypothetical protein
MITGAMPENVRPGWCHLTARHAVLVTVPPVKPAGWPVIPSHQYRSRRGTACRGGSQLVQVRHCVHGHAMPALAPGAGAETGCGVGSLPGDSGRPGSGAATISRAAGARGVPSPGANSGLGPASSIAPCPRGWDPAVTGRRHWAAGQRREHLQQPRRLGPVGGGEEDGSQAGTGRGLPYAFGRRRCPVAGGIPRSGRGYSYAAAGCGAASLRNAAAWPKVSPRG